MQSLRSRILAVLRRWILEFGFLATASIVWVTKGSFWGIYVLVTAMLFALGHHLLKDKAKTSLRLQNKQPFDLHVTDIEIPPEALYSAAVSLTVHSDANSWIRLYTLLTANSIMLLAWATVFAAALPNWLKGQVCFFLALPGFLLSTAWAPFGSRNRTLHRRWGDFYSALERAARSGVHVGPGASAETLRYQWIEEHCKSGLLVVAVPLAFADVFFFAMLKSLFLWRGW